jgi:hypothetical protein
MNNSRSFSKNTNSVSKLSTMVDNTKSNILKSETSINLFKFDQLKTLITNNMSYGLRVYFVIIVPVIILLIYIIYKYNFKNRIGEIINDIKSKTKSENKKQLQQCYQLDITMQFKLCDYFISSSYMSPCIGNQHFDYVSTDMITHVIQSGARYIQLPICESDVTLNALPVIGTCQYGQRIISSLNTIEIRETFNIIRNNAFILNNTDINYPMFIHLILNTNNKFTLNTITNHIKAVFGDVLLPVKNYKTFPIFLEKLCNLLGKVVIFATMEYKGSTLEELVIPLDKLFQIYHYSELDKINLSAGDIFTNIYNSKLSSKEQTESNKAFKMKYSSIEDIVKNVDTVGKNIMNDKEILNNLASFNKVGMTLVKAQNPEDVISSNYNFNNALYYGCQFITMNFQINDNNMNNYLEVFKDSSFRLKPSSMRFTEKEEPIPNLLALYDTIIPKEDNVLNNTLIKYENLLIAFEPYTLPNTFLTMLDTNLRFLTGNKISSKLTSTTNNKIGIEQCFIITKSNVSTGTHNTPLFIQSASDKKRYITYNNASFIMSNKGKDKQALFQQSFFFEKSRVTDSEQGEQLISIKLVDPQNVLYMAFENKIVKAYAESPQIQAMNNMSFYIRTIPFQMHIKIVTLFGGSMKSMSGNIIGVLENNTTDGTTYIIEPGVISNRNFNYLTDEFYLQNADTGKYLGIDILTGFLNDHGENTRIRLHIETSKGYFQIVNSIGNYLILMNKNLLKFEKKNLIISNENLFLIDLKYII